MSKPALLNVAIIAANIGAAELEFAVKKVHKLNVMKKGPTDYVTEVDRRVEEIVFEKIKEYYPDDNFLGEESGHGHTFGQADNPMSKALMFFVNRELVRGWLQWHSLWAEKKRKMELSLIHI